MNLQVKIVKGPEKGSVFSVTEGEPLVIGRGPQSHTRINDPYMSRVHCSLALREGEIILTSEGSGKTLVRGNAVKVHKLHSGDEFQAGECIFRLVHANAHIADTVQGGPGASPKAQRSSKPESFPEIQSLVGQSFGNYRLDSVIATGSSGVVFKATDTEKDQPAAVKVLSPNRVSDEEAKQRFIRAMKTMLPIHHPNLVRIYQAGKSGPYCWVAMEYIDGENLTKVIERIGIEGMLDWRDVWRVGMDIASALQAAYEHKVVHRNVTPTNIIRRHSDKTCILGDLMLAKALEGKLAIDLTVTGQILGDPAYLSLESFGGDLPLDCRSDIYGLGCTMYALLTGRPPFRGETLPELVRQKHEAAPAPPRNFQLSVQGHFEGIVLKMISKLPDDRYENPARLLAELDRVGKFNGLKRN
jgi:serine/threonine protein kinase